VPPEKWLLKTGKKHTTFFSRCLTLPETNVAPETLGLEDEFPFWEGLLTGAIC